MGKSNSQPPPKHTALCSLTIVVVGIKNLK